MRPATSLLADGPQNLHDAIVVAAHAGAGQGASSLPPPARFMPVR